jgi:hypothetical protein
VVEEAEPAHRAATIASASHVPSLEEPEVPTDREALRSGVATTYSLAAGVSLAVLVGWLAASAIRHQWVAVGAEGFFEASAQVLPVLLLTFAIERVFFERATSQLATRAGAIVAFAAVLLVSGVGEVLALAAIAWTGGPPRGLRVLGGLAVTMATAGSVVLIVGFAATRSGFVLDLKAGLQILRKGPPAEYDPRASPAARLAALFLGLVAAAFGVVGGGTALVLGISESSEYPEVLAIGIALALALFGVLGIPGLLYLRRSWRRDRERKRWWAKLPRKYARFSDLSDEPVRSLPYAARQVLLQEFKRLVDSGACLKLFADQMTRADERLNAAELAALKSVRAELHDAAERVTEELRAAEGERARGREALDTPAAPAE